MRRQLLALGLLACLHAAPAAAAEDSVAHLVFEPGRFAGISEPQTLRYRFETHGRGVEEAKPSPGVLQIREVNPDGSKKVWLDLFEGSAKRSVGPFEARDQNPLLLVFLQMDVTEMSRLTSGASNYFQQQIRKKFNDMVPTETVEVEVGGQPVPATRITLRPFQGDPRIDQFPAFRDKSYEITVADSVPGGLWSIVTRTPDPNTGELILEKSMTFEGVER